MKSLKNWKPETFEVTGGKYLLKNRKNQSFTSNGSDRTEKNTYTFNSLGFRGDSFPFIDNSKKTIMAVGCSYTEGIDVNDDETWPFFISKLLNSNHINFGFTGRSNDYISRVILTYTDIVKPDLVLIMYTHPTRMEYFTENGDPEPFHPHPWDYFEKNNELWNNMMNYTNDEFEFQNWYKNHLLIKYFLQTKNIPFLWNGTFLNTNYDDGLRFDGDLKVEYGKHQTSEQNKIYSEKLFKHIKEKNVL
jgi:hypothetical protein